MAESTSLKEMQSFKELREGDLDAVFGGRHRCGGSRYFGREHYGNPQSGNQHFSDNIVQTNIAIEIAVALGGNVTQLIDQSNIA